MATGFHNHQVEWKPFESGERPMDVLAKNTPKDVVLQLDAGTAVEMGVDPVAWIKANPGRIKSIHLKDWGKGEGRGYTVAFGEGDVQWKALFQAAESTGGVEYYLIEQEHAGPDGEIAMAQRCLNNYRKMQVVVGSFQSPVASVSRAAANRSADWRLVTGGSNSDYFFANTDVLPVASNVTMS